MPELVGYVTVIATRSTKPEAVGMSLTEVRINGRIAS
jgi:hypothetical protein